MNETMQNSARTRAIAAVSLAALFMVVVGFDFESFAQAGTPRQRISLDGTASGGIVSVFVAQQLCPRFVSIQTTQGESAENVVRRLVEAISQTDPFGWKGDQFVTITPGPARRVPDVEMAGNTLTLLGRKYVLSGSDKGFLVLSPPLSVSGSYDPGNQTVTISWVNPSSQYDEIQVSGNALLPGATNYVFDWTGHETNDIFPYWLGVVVKRGDVSSPPASINLRTTSQEELDSFPFYMGVAANWSAWAGVEKPGAVRTEQGTKAEVPLKGCIDGPDDKPFYQLIKTTQRGVQGGVYRRFLGLKPGHTYKVEVRLNTLKMDAITNDWAFSFHAAYDQSRWNGSDHRLKWPARRRCRMAAKARRRAAWPSTVRE